MPNDFVSTFIDFSADFESPTNFWRWSAYALVSATLRNNVWHDAGLEKCYPNIYVLLLADSAKFRKGGSFQLVTDLLKELHHTKIYDGRATIQAVLEKLSTDTAGKKGLPIQGGCCLILAEELASFFVEDPQLIPLITNIYRPREVFDYDLRGTGFTVKNLCISMLAASNEINLRDVYDSRAVYGGLLGRTFLIKPDARRPPNSLLTIDPSKYDKKILLEPLIEISKLRGQVKFTQAAIDLYEDWYRELYKSLEKIEDPGGVLSRIHTSVLKLSIIIAASNYTLTIEANHIESAISNAINLKPNYEAYVMGSGRSSQSQIGMIFLEALWQATINPTYNGNGTHGKLSRKKFLLNFWNQVSAEDLDRLIVTLDQAGMIKTSGERDGICYEMTPVAREKFEQKITLKKKQSP